MEIRPDALWAASMSVLYTGIGELVTNDPAQGDGSALGIVDDGAIVVDGDRDRAGSGAGATHPPPTSGSTAAVPSVIPGFVDSHAHLVFAGERSAEFAARMSGQPYAAGGIATTVAATRAADDATLTRRRRRGWRTNCSAPESRPSRPRAATG